MSYADPRWAELMDALDLPEDGCSIEVLVDKVAKLLGDPIRLEPITQPVPYSGMVIRESDGYLLKYGVAGGAYHQANNVGHELAHLLLGHEPDTPVAPDSCGGHTDDPTGGMLQLLSRDTADLMAPRRALCRTTFEDTREADAETLAWLLLDRAGRRRAPGGGPLARVLAPQPSRRWRR